MGSRNGRTAFNVKGVVLHPEGDEPLPVLEVDFLDAVDVDAARECAALQTIDGAVFECPAPDDGTS